MRVLIPSPPHYAPRLARAFQSVGDDIETISVPMIESVKLTSNVTSHQEQIDTADLIILPSRMAIDTFAEAGLMAEGTRLISMGRDIDYAEERLGVRPTLEPAEASPQGIVSTLAEKRRARQNIVVFSPRFVGVEEPTTIPDMMADLERIGQQVIRIDAYETHATSNEIREEAYRRIGKNEIDAIAFTSAGEIFSFMSGCKSDTNDLLEQTTVACFGPYTAQRAKSAGVRVDFVSPKFASFEEYATNLTEILRKRNTTI